MGGASSKTKETKAGGPMRGVVPGAGQDEASAGGGAAAGAAAPVPATPVPADVAGDSGDTPPRVGEEEDEEEVATCERAVFFL